MRPRYLLPFLYLAALTTSILVFGGCASMRPERPEDIARIGCVGLGPYRLCGVQIDDTLVQVRRQAKELIERLERDLAPPAPPTLPGVDSLPWDTTMESLDASEQQLAGEMARLSEALRRLQETLKRLQPRPRCGAWAGHGYRCV